MTVPAPKRQETLATLEDKARIESIPLSERYAYRSTYDALFEAAKAHGSKTAISFQLKGEPSARAHEWTYAQYITEVTRAANLFRKLGATPQRPVALLLPNLPETLFAKFAAEAAGAVNPINPLLEPEQIAAILRDSNAGVLVTLSPFPKTDLAERAAEALRDAPGVEALVEIDMKRYVGAPLSWIIPFIRPKRLDGHKARVLDYHAAVATEPGDRLTFEIEGGHDRIGAYFHTGGTTGDPKLAVHRQGSMLFMGWIAQHCVFTPKDVILCAVPLFHVFGAYVIALSGAMVGAQVVLASPAGYRGDGVVKNFWKLVERWKATFFIVVPTAVSALNQRDVDGADVSSLQYTICGSAPLPAELFKSFEAKTGVKILEGYGQTEATCICSCNPPDGERRIGSVGYPLPYTSMKIALIDENDGFSRECATDEIGEILIEGPSVFAGYKEEKRNRGLFVDCGDGKRWLRSGDLGRLDSEGYFWITGRAKDLIIRGGHNIDPGMIEDALSTHPAVAFSGAIGQPDAHSGEVPCAYVELNEGATATADELKTYAAEHVSERAGRPVYVEILDELPKTAVGKVFKPDLRKRAIKRVYEDELRKAGIDCAIRVEKHKTFGLIVVAEPSDNASREQVAAVLNRYAARWKLDGEPDPAEG